MSEFFKAPDGRQMGAIAPERRTATIAFLGSVLNFSPLFLRIIQSEFVGLDVCRVDTLAQLDASPERAAMDLRIVVFDQAHAECLGRNLAYFRDRLQGLQLVFGYSDVTVARKLYALTEAAGGADLRFLPMNVQVDVWISIVRLLMSGQRYVPEEVLPPAATVGTSTFSPQKPQATSTALSRLTDRELAVLARVSTGEQNKLIAEKLGLSEHTVKLHIHNAIAKISARNRTEAAIWYLSRGPAAGPGSVG
jgi:DNA-binding CsgD family transcriptional regulator